MKLLLSLLLAATAHGADWKVGAAKVDITPTEPVWMAGFGSRTKPHQSVLSPIYAKALAIEDATGATAVLVIAELNGIPAALGQRIAGRAQAQFGLSRDR